MSVPATTRFREFATRLQVLYPPGREFFLQSVHHQCQQFPPGSITYWIYRLSQHGVVTRLDKGHYRIERAMELADFNSYDPDRVHRPGEMSLKNRLVQVINQLPIGQPFALSELADQHGLSRTTVGTYLAAYAEKGLIQRVKIGVYCRRAELPPSRARRASRDADDVFNDQEHRAWMAQAKTPRPRYNPWERA
jgi:predicted transcriptional regulator of viral defense system